MISTTLIKTEGGGGLPYFIVELTSTFIGTLKHKLQATVPVLCWYVFTETTIVKKKVLLHS